MPRLQVLQKLHRRHRKHKHHHTLLIAASLFLTYAVFSRPEASGFIGHLGTLAYPGAFLIGIFFTTFATTIPAIATFLLLGDVVNPLLAAPLGGAGAVIGDFALYKIIRGSFSPDLRAAVFSLEKKLFNHRLRVRRRLWHYLLPALAGFIIASPLPDELAVTLLGTAHFDPKKFVVLSFVMNSLGILALLLIGQAV